MSTDMIGLFVVIAVILVMIALWYNGKKKFVVQILGLLVHKAEVYFSAGENQAKIDFVLIRIEGVIPTYLRWVWSEEWIKKQIKFVLLKVEKELGYQSTMEEVADKAKREVLNYAESYAKKSITTAADYMTERLINASVNGDYNLVDNEQVKLVNTELKEKIGLGVNLKAFVTGETDFKGKNTATAGLEFERKF